MAVDNHLAYIDSLFLFLSCKNRPCFKETDLSFVFQNLCIPVLLDLKPDWPRGLLCNAENCSCPDTHL